MVDYWNFGVLECESFC